jgi:biotin operon repressor
MKETVEVLSLLRSGQENAVSAEYLTSITGINERVLRYIILALRLTGTCILSGLNGYWLPSENEREAYRECKGFTRKMIRRGVTSIKIARATEAYMRKLDGQITINDFYEK